ncbi:arginase [Photobacterium kishitanii]|uniref:Arginase n=1 Tax=Photobacterium kishitanii TaxID=318456 RepID=A0AAX0YXF8_9GAMM|nr:formimidoylglutamase [Photobacterium kishitanii]KJG57343.1 arginase [Photobacterium kishitanii]PSU20019.1 arginase [Photobacterium kishitanii]PSV11159.1 arginase [Photobacterium kishitanii]PSX16874.1 arginase [Photobacterium kishitanii]PSX25542.1 arginase [Photobacterium kishitanii]
MLVDQLKKLFKNEPQKPMLYHRKHTLISPYTQQCQPGVMLVGVISDLSLDWGRGLQGAKEGPASIRRILPRTHAQTKLPFYDAGDIEQTIDDQSFVAVSQRQHQLLLRSLRDGHFPVVLGGGHEISIASYQALSDFSAESLSASAVADQQRMLASPRVGVINFDAHFELRPSLSLRAGSAFHTAWCYSKEQQRSFDFLGLGICDHANSQAMFKLAEELGCQWLLDNQMTTRNKKHIQAQLDNFIEQVDCIQLSIDLDVFSSSIAPGANMTRMHGVSLSMVEWAIKHIMASGKVKIVDIAELNPEYDYDNQTAKLATKLIQTIVHFV